MNEEPLREKIKDLVRQALADALPASSSPPQYFAPWTGTAYEAHPSGQLFNVSEAATALGELLEFVEAQSCTIEKNKPCDHCGMCRRLGF